MEIHIDNVVSTVRTVDEQALLSPEVMRGIVNSVLEVVRAEREHEERVSAEQGLLRGSSQRDHRA